MATVVHVPIPSDAGAREALLDRARALRGIEHPRLQPLLGLEVGPDETFVVRLGSGGAADLPAVLAVRTGLSPAEVCGVLIGLAQGLAALHSAGLAHGEIVAQDVLLDAEGVALLRARIVATPGVTGAGRGRSASTAAADVHALASFVVGLLSADRAADDEAIALRAVLAPALAPDPLVRPEVGTLAAQADAALRPEPVRLPERSRLAAAALGGAARSLGHSVSTGADAVPGPSGGAAERTRARARRRVVGLPGRAEVVRSPSGEDRRRHRAPRGVRVRRRAVLWAGAVVAATAVVVVGIEVAGPAPLPETSATSPGAAAASGAPTTGPTEVVVMARADADPARAAADLTRRRLELVTGSPGSVAEIDLPGSDAHAADTALLAELADAGTEVQGAEVRVLGATTRQDGDVEARVDVEYEIGEHVQVAPDGTTTRVAETGPRTAELLLGWTESGWRVVAVG